MKKYLITLLVAALSLLALCVWVLVSTISAPDDLMIAKGSTEFFSSVLTVFTAISSVYLAVKLGDADVSDK